MRGRSTSETVFKSLAARDNYALDIGAFANGQSHSLRQDEEGVFAYVDVALWSNHDGSGGLVNHAKDEYARYECQKVHHQGVYQHYKEKHLHRYLSEFEFHRSNRVRLGVNDLPAPIALC
jgi:hypothetical protein